MLQIEDASIAYGNDVLFSKFNLQLKRGLVVFPVRQDVEKHLFSMPYSVSLH